MMTVIGLAGGSGSGKTTVSTLFSEHNILPVNTDEIYHDLTSSKTPCLSAIVDEFGESILNREGILDRKALGAIVFADHEKMRRLNTISHYYVLCAVREIIADARKRGYYGVIVDAPLLFESGFDRECDVIVAVVANKEIRIGRIVRRDGISVDKAKQRIDNQLSDEFLSSRADYIITNNNSACELRRQVEQVVDSIMNNK